MTGLRNSSYGKRLRASAQSPDDRQTPRKRRKRTVQIVQGVEPETTTPERCSTPSRSALSTRMLNVDDSPPGSSPWVPDSPLLSKEYGDRFIPLRESEDVRTPYHLLDSEDKENVRRRSARLTDAVTMQGVPP